MGLRAGWVGGVSDLVQDSRGLDRMFETQTRIFQQVLEAEVRRLLGTGLVTRKHLLEGPGVQGHGPK